jgi:hypothetical protein
MKRAIVGLMIMVFCVGCASVSNVGSSAWRKTRSLFGGGGKPEAKKVTVETYPSRTTISTLEQPKMQVQTQPKKVEVQPRPTVESVPPQTGPKVEKKIDRENLPPEERRVQEQIDRTVENLQKKHKGGGIMGIFGR